MFLLCVSVHRGPPRSRSGGPPHWSRSRSGDPQVKVRRGALPQVKVRRGAPQVKVRRGAPQVKVRRGAPQFKVLRAPPRSRSRGGPPRSRSRGGPPWSRSRSGGGPPLCQGPSQGLGGPPVKVQKCGERGRYASCAHAGGLSFSGIFSLLRCRFNLYSYFHFQLNIQKSIRKTYK